MKPLPPTAAATLTCGGSTLALLLREIRAGFWAQMEVELRAAGHELNVSAAAVSRMVHLLEERLGVALFERKANRLVTTAAGRAYQSGLTPIFDALASLTAQVTAPSGSDTSANSRYAESAGATIRMVMRSAGS